MFAHLSFNWRIGRPADQRDNPFSLCPVQNQTREYGRLVSLALDPYPPQLPGKVTVSATIQLDKPVEGHVRMDLQIVKKLGFLGYALQIPCIGNVGTWYVPRAAARVSLVSGC